MADRLDMVVLGATGFTGRHAVNWVYKLSKAKGRSLTWGIAGRNVTKLQAILDALKEETKDSIDGIPIITVDLNDENSIKEMTQRTKLVINCCGPYRFMGEQVVKACIETGTHQVDVSGEPQYLEGIQLKYHDQAKEAGVYILGACGFDSIPCDLGLVFLQKKFDGTLNSVDTYLVGGTEGPQLPGPSINFGTWESAVYGLACANELREIRRKLFTKRFPSLKPVVPMKNRPFKSDIADGWAMPFLGSDRSIMRRSQYYFYTEKNQRPVQIQTYFTVSSLWAVILCIFFGAIFSILCRFRFGQQLLLKYPALFSGGFFGTEEPAKEKIENTWFKFILHGKGWKERLAGPEDQYTTPPNKAMVVEVKGTNPGYGATCTCLVLAGIVVLTETNKLPDKGGVFPPGAAFADTSLIEQLNENGLTFDVVSETSFQE